MTIYFEIMIGMAVGSVAGFVFAYKGVLVNRSKNRMRDIELFHLETREAIDDVVEKTSLENAMLIRIHNAGGKLMAGTPLFSSIIEEKPKVINLAIKDDWQSMPVDDEYFSVVKRIQKNSRTLVLTDDMRHGIIRTVYEGMGVNGSYLFEVYATDMSYYYVSFPFTNNYIELSENVEQMKLQYSVSKLRVICKKADRKGILK